MPDDRTLLEKLQAMADQTASPDEAEIAREMIKRMLGMADIRTMDSVRDRGKVLSREAILEGTPDREKIGGTVRMQTKSGTWFTVDVDEMDISIMADKIEESLP